MVERNIAAVLHGVNDLRIDELPIPDPKPWEVLIRTKSVGICGSDIHYWKHGKIGNFIIKSPLILGHETSGFVESVGSDVTNLAPGDRIAIEPGIPCKRCFACISGRYNLCPDVHFLATPPVHGSLTSYFTHSADFCYRLPDQVSWDEGLLLEPLSVGIHACRRGGMQPGSKVLVMGAGPIGLVTMLAAKALGATSVVSTDINESRLNVATSLGADLVVDANHDDLAQVILDSFGPVDLSIDCTGAESAVSAAILATQAGGRVVLVGLGQDRMSLPIVDAATREVDLVGIFRYVNTYPTALNLLISGKLDVSTLATHHFPIEEIVPAFEVADSNMDGVIKVVVTL